MSDPLGINDDYDESPETCQTTAQENTQLKARVAELEAQVTALIDDGIKSATAADDAETKVGHLEAALKEAKVALESWKSYYESELTKCDQERSPG